MGSREGLGSEMKRRGELVWGTIGATRGWWGEVGSGATTIRDDSDEVVGGGLTPRREGERNFDDHVRMRWDGTDGEDGTGGWGVAGGWMLRNDAKRA